MPKKAKPSTPREICAACGQPMPAGQVEIQAIVDQLPRHAFVRVKLLLQLLPFSEATLWRKVAKGDFPKPVKLSERITGWRAEEVRAWLTEKGLVH